MVARVRAVGESFKAYRENLRVEERIERMALRRPISVLHDARPNGRINTAPKNMPAQWKWTKGVTFVRPRAREQKRLSSRAVAA